MDEGDQLLGRADETAQLLELVGRARNGRGGSLLIVGEPGIGKTTLLEFASGLSGFRHLRLDGLESEVTMPYAAVHRLVLPLRDHLSALPTRQREALGVASGQVEGMAPDRYLVGLGVLGLLTLGAAETPLVCVVDDAHWLDRESTDALAFVARRLAVEPVAILFSARDEEGITDRMGGIPEMTLGGLDASSALSLLARSVREPLDPAVAVAIAEATRGNPLALTDLGEELSTHELERAGIAADPLPIGRHLEEHYLRRVRQAADGVQEWVLLAAADSTGNVDLIKKAAGVLELSDEDHDLAEVIGLVELKETVRFRHPLVRSAVYNAATGSDRRRVHQALAVAADRLGAVELEAWHAAKATVGTDPRVADRLQHAADLAARRGGFGSRASILARAAELTPHGDIRDARLVGAAEGALAVGAAQVAKAQLDALSDEVADPVVRGRVIMVRSAIGLFLADGSVPFAAERLVAAADSFHGLDPALEQQALVRAFQSCLNAQQAMRNITPVELGKRFEAGAAVQPGPWAVILRGLAALVLSPYEASLTAVRAAFDEFKHLQDHEMMEHSSAVTALATWLWDEDGCVDALERAANASRNAGALQHLDTILWVEALVEATQGRWRSARHCDELVREVRRAMGYDGENVVNAAVMALSGTPQPVILMIADGAEAAGFGGVSSSAHAALAVCDIANREYRKAYERLRPMVAQRFVQVTATYYGDYVEAAHRSGHSSEAERVAHELKAMASANGASRCRGVAERSLGLVEATERAEGHFVAAIDALSGTRAEVDLARAHLVYGEWLRRRRRRGEACRHLQLAVTHFEEAGADLFLPRTKAELEAAGGKAGTTRESYTTNLTAQELTIARLAADSHTNVEIGSKLFISPNTVDYHLRKVFQKLGISSRRQLTDRLAASD